MMVKSTKPGENRFGEVSKFRKCISLWGYPRMSVMVSDGRRRIAASIKMANEEKGLV
jgi:hypothetical protein